MSGRYINFINGNKDNNFLPMPNNDIKANSIIYLCSPNNPTGATYSHEELKESVLFALKTSLLII